MSADKIALRMEDLWLSLAPGPFSDAPREVLRGLTLAIPRGVSVAVLGSTGSGKSLLCRAATAFLHGVPVKELKGAVWFEGRNLLEAGQARLMKIRGAQIGHLLQNAHEHFHPRLTIAQHFDLLLRQKRPRLGGRTEHAMSYLYRAGIVDPDELLLGRVFPGELEVMTRQKIMIAMVLACEPDLLVADEPTAEFDSQSVARLAHGLERLKRERGLAILFATGWLRRAEQFGDKVAVLDQGVIAEIASPGNLSLSSENPQVQAFVAGDPVAGRPRERLLAPGKPNGLRAGG